MLARNSVLILPLLLSANACGSGSSHPQSPPNPCDVAAAYVEMVINEAKGRPLVFSAADEQFDLPKMGGEWWKMNGERPVSATAPPPALVKRLEDQGNRSAVAQCSSVREFLTGRKIAFGQNKVDAVTSSSTGELFDATINRISVPVVSEDGKQAVLASSGVSGPLAGGGFLQFLERQSNGKWKVVAFSPLWVS